MQASVVHLQGVPLSKRFALVPLGPPLLSYSSTAKVQAHCLTCLEADGPNITINMDAWQILNQGGGLKYFKSVIPTGHAHLQQRSKRGTIGSGQKLQEGGAHQGLVRATGTHSVVLGLGNATNFQPCMKCTDIDTLWLQPNRRLLLNYGIVTDDNPHDK